MHIKPYQLFEGEIGTGLFVVCPETSKEIRQTLEQTLSQAATQLGVVECEYVSPTQGCSYLIRAVLPA